MRVYFPGWNFAATYGTSPPRQRLHKGGNTACYPTQPGKPPKRSHAVRHQPENGGPAAQASRRPGRKRNSRTIPSAICGSTLPRFNPGKASRSSSWPLSAPAKGLLPNSTRGPHGSSRPPSCGACSTSDPIKGIPSHQTTACSSRPGRPSSCRAGTVLTAFAAHTGSSTG